MHQQDLKITILNKTSKLLETIYGRYHLRKAQIFTNVLSGIGKWSGQAMKRQIICKEMENKKMN